MSKRLPLFHGQPGKSPEIEILRLTIAVENDERGLITDEFTRQEGNVARE